MLTHEYQSTRGPISHVALRERRPTQESINLSCPDFWLIMSSITILASMARLWFTTKAIESFTTKHSPREVDEIVKTSNAINNGLSLALFVLAGIALFRFFHLVLTECPRPGRRRNIETWPMQAVHYNPWIPRVDKPDFEEEKTPR